MTVPVVATTTVARDDLFTPDEEGVLTGFLAGYAGLTREAYALDLRQFVVWCTERRNSQELWIGFPR